MLLLFKTKAYQSVQQYACRELNKYKINSIIYTQQVTFLQSTCRHNESTFINFPHKYINIFPAQLGLLNSIYCGIS